MRLFHVVPLADWEDFQASGRERWEPPSLAAEGFCHLSLRHQLAGTLALHFAGHATVLLLEVDPDEVTGSLSLEVSRGGERFPHVHAALSRGAFLRAWRLVRSEAGDLVPPVLGESASLDDPPGGSVRQG